LYHCREANKTKLYIKTSIRAIYALTIDLFLHGEIIALEENNVNL